MLVLTRKRSEMIQIGDNIVVKVIRTGKSIVKIGIEAPANVRVLRAELAEEPKPAPHPQPVKAGEKQNLAVTCSDESPCFA